MESASRGKVRKAPLISSWVLAYLTTPLGRLMLPFAVGARLPEPPSHLAPPASDDAVPEDVLVGEGAAIGHEDNVGVAQAPEGRQAQRAHASGDDG
eukprot:10842464-Alexandrium_andersonii.AAC.1